VNAKQKKFITEKLIPFILRAEGNGFAMDTWKQDFTKQVQNDVENGDDFYFDHVNHKFPVCGTVACIGGSIQCLAGVRGMSNMADMLGLTINQTNTPFYSWDTGRDVHGWPMKFQRQFEARKTPLGKAKVAVALLREVVKTSGECLNPAEAE